jgi:hypothetical protein
MDLYPSPFVTMRSSSTAVAFCDLFTGHQLVLKGSAGSELAAVFNQATTLESFLSKYPAEAQKAVSLSLLTAEPTHDPYLRTMLSSIDIEPAGSCNAVCGMCPRAAMTRPKTVMSTATFDAVCRQLGETFPGAIQKVFFCGFGEPLQNPHLPEMSRRVRSLAPQAGITVISNGSLLTDSMIESLVASEINLFSCSYQSNTRRRYESIMRGLNFDSTTAGLKRLIAAATEDNSSEIPEMVTAWENLGAQVVVNSLHNRGGYLTIEGAGGRHRHRRSRRGCGRSHRRGSRRTILSGGNRRLDRQRHRGRRCRRRD